MLILNHSTFFINENLAPFTVDTTGAAQEFMHRVSESNMVTLWK